MSVKSVKTDLKQSKPRVRFAPSPTGMPHIGNTRTALFNYLFAKHDGGKFIVRIEDTDRERYVPDSLEKILEILKAVGIKWDEGPEVGGPFAPYEQSKRLKLYRERAEELVKRGKAYYCFCTKERLEKLRQSQQKKGQRPRYDGNCRRLSKVEVERRLAAREAVVIRLKVPDSGETVWEDLIDGKIAFKNELLDDQVLLKSDGFPTYHLGVVVDDHEMEITHILRGAEWISSTPKHLLLYQAFGWQAPAIGHFSVILGSDKKKLSKRHGAKSVLDYLAEGYLPEALVPFMAYLGWSYQDNSQLLTMNELITHFSLQRLQKQNPIFDIAKLNYFNGKAIRALVVEELVKRMQPFVPANWKASEVKLKQIAPLIKDRLVTLKEVESLADFFFTKPLVDRQLILKYAQHEGEAVRDYLDKVKTVIGGMKEFGVTELESGLRELVGAIGWEPRAAFMTLRLVIMGKEATPPLFETLKVIGRDETLDRLSYARSSFS
ncbi:glutamate--tRNA ligase [Microgenomates group bacterium RIFCSPLOWO2_01_FULL_46_13]|nr:MAG: glutamate--tRNA ligase [Microgenomates group bacterium RIFCSPHIGHO2_01_FULL_45_11]OGV94971.1 MAG: glutamate--tRNA ligase [Microgenomates group bacterium RIFCSPLOWO2_01_FULL_46_13]